jgi:hypothetical protein
MKMYTYAVHDVMAENHLSSHVSISIIMTLLYRTDLTVYVFMLSAKREAYETWQSILSPLLLYL